MIGWPSSRPLRCHGAILPLVILAFAPACFRGADTTKIVCGDDDHCPSGYQCRVDPNLGQGRCERRSPVDGNSEKPADDALLPDAPAVFDAPVGGGGTSADGGTTGLGGVSGQGGTLTIGGGAGGGGATDASLGAGGVPASGGLAATGGALAGGGGIGGVVAAGGAAGQSSQIGTGGQGPAGGSGGSSVCSLPGQEFCQTACTDLKTDSSNCGGCGNLCDQGQRCSGGSCVCDGTSCPNGCCSDKTCVDQSAQAAGKCGKPGMACVACSTDAYCTQGACACLFPDRSACGSEMCIDLQTNKDHCGSCSKTCKDGCSAGQCFVHLATVAEDEIGIAVNATDVYFTMSRAGTVSRVSRSGGAVQVLATSQPFPAPGEIALDSKNVYWVNQGASQGTGSVMKLSLTGNTPEALATSEIGPIAIAIDGSNVYWAGYADVGEGAIMKVPIAGGTKVQLAVGDSMRYPYRIAVDATDVYWINAGSGPVTDGSIMRVPQAGGTIVTLAADLGPGQGLVVTGGTVYFVSKSGVQSVSSSGGAVSTFKSTPPGAQQWVDIAADTTSIYLSGRGADLVRIDLNTGATTRLASDASCIALDDSNVFWATQTDINVTPKVP